MQITCSKCALIFEVTPLCKGSNGSYVWEFEGKRGMANTCRDCRKKYSNKYRQNTHNKTTHKYEKTKPGFIMRLYRNMLSRITGVQKQKAHLYLGKELLSKDEFYGWAMNHATFDKLFEEYKQANYDRRFAPTVDRINSDLGYTLSNMEWVTHSENSRRGSLSRARKYVHGGRVDQVPQSPECNP